MAKIIMDENETVNEAVEVENTEAPELDADFSVDADSVENTSTDTEPPTDGSGIDTDMSVETPEETTPTDKEESSDNTQTEGNPDENIDNSVDDGISSLPLEDTDLKPVYDEPTGQADSVGTGKKWTDGYAIKTKASDDDEAMILSTSEKANKRIKFSGIWDWIVDKMANAVVSKLTTTDKTVLGAINELNSKSYHNIPRLVPKDITAYYKDGTLWKRLSGTDGYSLYQDIYVGDYFQMSRVISAKNPDSTLQLSGTDWVTIASIGGLAHNGDNMGLTPNHLVMVPGKGFGGTQHFGKSRMNPTNTTVGGYKASEMNTTVLGAIVTAGSTAADATINQQLYAEFGTHLKKTRELVTNEINATGISRYGSNNGCSNGWDWIDAQAILMSEVELYGSTVWSSSGFDTGNANHQFELFAHSKSAINNRSAWYWEKDVASASEFCYCFHVGVAGHGDASGAGSYVRPRFVIAA